MFRTGWTPFGIARFNYSHAGCLPDDKLAVIEHQRRNFTRLEHHRNNNTLLRWQLGITLYIFFIIKQQTVKKHCVRLLTFKMWKRILVDYFEDFLYSIYQSSGIRPNFFSLPSIEYLILGGGNASVCPMHLQILTCAC